jgi:hypothetical protein
MSPLPNPSKGRVSLPHTSLPLPGNSAAATFLVWEKEHVLEKKALKEMVGAGRCVWGIRRRK